ncbi:MAG: hypothetical protein V2I35_11185, partial [Desulfocapsaceae bacterium]|nr:hypothetical protein [Desulfocapsaceae bacterium]
NSCGAARLEILFYEKAHSSAGSEQIILYGVAENSCSRLKPFTLTINTCWFDTTSHHPEDRYFDSIIVDRSAAPRIIPGSSLELSLWNSGTLLTAHCSAVLRFASARDSNTPHPAHSEVPFSGLTTIPAVAAG